MNQMHKNVFHFVFYFIRQIADEILAAASVKPKAILFDLDYTVWPFFLDTYTFGPPFKPHEDGFSVVDRASNVVTMLPDAADILCAGD